MLKAKTLTLLITLRDSEPEIWRQVVVDNRMTLAKLHFIIQIAMGWDNSHLHVFSEGSNVYGEPSDDPWEPAMFDERKVKLLELLPRKGSKIEYEYDFGDSWEHRIEVVATRAHDQRKHFPAMLLDGARACPPEDIGGIYRYNDFIHEVLPNPKHPEYDSLIEWLGESFDPAHFDFETVEQRLKALS